MEQAILVDEKAMAAQLGVQVKTCQTWRVKGYGPPFIKIGRLVKYLQSDIQTWIESQRRQSTSEAN